MQHGELAERYLLLWASASWALASRFLNGKTAYPGRESSAARPIPEWEAEFHKRKRPGPKARPPPRESCQREPRLPPFFLLRCFLGFFLAGLLFRLRFLRGLFSRGFLLSRFLGAFLCGGLRRGLRRGHYFFRLFSHDHQFFFLFHDLFGLAAQLLVLQPG